MVSLISKEVQPQHVNQVFTGAPISRALLGQNETFVNALISPTGTVGMVKISTGPLSSQAPDGIVPIETAIMMLKDMGADSVKFFNMKGLTYIEEYKAIAKACADFDFSLEPTGGIDLDNFAEILQIALDAGVKKSFLISIAQLLIKILAIRALKMYVSYCRWLSKRLTDGVVSSM